MKQPYLEVTYRKGKVLAAYLYLPRGKGAKSVRTQRVDPGLVIDLAADGKAIGIEITAPGSVTPTVLNRVLKELGFDPVPNADLAPLRAA